MIVDGKSRIAEKDDGHHARIVDLERHVRLAAVNLPPNDALGVLNADLALRLRHGNNRGDHEDQKQAQENKHDRADARLGAGSAWNKRAPRLNQARRKLRKDANGNNQRHSIADPALGDLISHPHEKHRPGGHGNDRHELKSNAGLGKQIQSQAIDRIHDAREKWIGLRVLERF